MKKMHTGDILFLYAPKKEFGKEEKLQAFVGMMEVVDETIEQVEMAP
jgi:EVE domain